MANNRLYIVDTLTGEYLCLGKCFGIGWHVGNPILYQSFMRTRNDGYKDETMLMLGTENDDEFYEAWIANGKNYNRDNEWEYF